MMYTTVQSLYTGAVPFKMTDLHSETRRLLPETCDHDGLAVPVDCDRCVAAAVITGDQQARIDGSAYAHLCRTGAPIEDVLGFLAESPWYEPGLSALMSTDARGVTVFAADTLLVSVYRYVSGEWRAHVDPRLSVDAWRNRSGPFPWTVAVHSSPLYVFQPVERLLHVRFLGADDGNGAAAVVLERGVETVIANRLELPAAHLARQYAYLGEQLIVRPA